MAQFFFLFLAIFTSCSDGGFAASLPTAQAFAPVVRTDGSRSNFQHESSTASTPHRPPLDLGKVALSRMNDSSSDDEPVAINSQKSLLPLAALGTLTLATLAAFTQYLPGPPIDATAPPPFFATLPYGVLFSGACAPYSPSLIAQDVFSSISCLAGASIFVKTITHAAKVGKLSPRDARKIIHTLSAPLFIILWPLFSKAYGARVFASIVPLIMALRLIAAGTGSGIGSGSVEGSESELAGAISRTGDRREALGGPFIYVLVLLFSVLLFWTDSPIGIVAVTTMAVGDGLADLIGRRFGSSNKWFFNKSKSMAGSAAFVAGSFAGSLGLISWLTKMNTLEPLQLTGLAGRLLAIAIICAGVELIPLGDDNWTVPVAAAVLSGMLLHA